MATGDNIIEVGAVIDLSQIIPGLQELVAQTQATTNEMRASLAQLDEPVKVGAVAPTPAAVGVTPESIEALSNVTLDLTLKQEVLKASVQEMVDEIAKEGGTTEVATSWTKRLADEELALGVVDQAVGAAERTLAEARGILIDQSQLLLLIQQQLADRTKLLTDAEAAATGATTSLTSATASGAGALATNKAVTLDASAATLNNARSLISEAEAAGIARVAQQQLIATLRERASTLEAKATEVSTAAPDVSAHQARAAALREEANALREKATAENIAAEAARASALEMIAKLEVEKEDRAEMDQEILETRTASSMLTEVGVQSQFAAQFLARIGYSAEESSAAIEKLIIREKEYIAFVEELTVESEANVEVLTSMATQLEAEAQAASQAALATRELGTATAEEVANLNAIAESAQAAAVAGREQADAAIAQDAANKDLLINQIGAIRAAIQMGLSAEQAAESLSKYGFSAEEVSKALEVLIEHEQLELAVGKTAIEVMEEKAVVLRENAEATNIAAIAAEKSATEAERVASAAGAEVEAIRLKTEELNRQALAAATLAKELENLVAKGAVPLAGGAVPPTPPPVSPGGAVAGGAPEEDENLAKAKNDAAAAAENEATQIKASTDAIVENTADVDSSIASNAALTESSAGVSAAAGQQSAALGGVTSASSLSAAQTKLVNDSAKDLAVSLMASGKSADQAASMMMQAGISSEKVNSVFVELGKPLKVIQTETSGVSAATQQMIVAQKAAGASSSELARTMQLAGLSGREIATQLQGLGFTTNEVSQTMAQLGIKVTGTRNEILRMAADAGATREQLEALNATIQEVSRSTGGMANSFGVARLEMGALDGSVGMMAGGLARIAATSKLLGPLMQAAFPLFAAYAMVTILVQMYEGFQKLSNAVMGYTEEVKKSEQANIKASQAAEVHAASVEDAYRKMGRTAADQAKIAGEGWTGQAQKGIETAEKQKLKWEELLGPISFVYEGYLKIKGSLDGLTDAANRAAKAQQDLSALHGQLNQQLAERDKNNLKMLASEQAVTNVGQTRVSQIESEINALGKKEELEKSIAMHEAAQKIIAGTAGQGEQFEAAQRVAEEFSLKREELTKKLGVAELEERISQEKAVTEAEKTYGLARIVQAERMAQEQYTAGKITLDKEVSVLEENEIKKFNLEKSTLEKRKAIAESERGAGKDPTAEIEAINGEIRALAVNHEAALTAIKANGAEARKRIDEEYARAVISGETKLANETVIARKDALKVLFEDGTLSEATYTKMLLSNEQQRTDIVNSELKKQRDLVNQFTRPDERAAKLKEADDAEAIEVQRHAANVESIRAASQKRVNEEEKKTITETLSAENTVATERVREEEKSTDEQIRQIDRLQSYGVISARERARQNIQLIDSENQVTLSIMNTAIAQAEAAKAAAVSTGAQEAAEKKIIELKKERVRVEQEIAAKSQKIVDDLLNYEIQKSQQAYNIIGNSFKSAFDKMLTEHTTFANVMTNFWNQMVQGWARMGLEILANYVQTLAKILIQEALTALKIQVIHSQSTSIKKATETLFDQFLTLLGIKRTSETTSETAKQSTAQTIADTKRQTAETVYATTYIADQQAETVAFSTAVARRAIAQTAASEAVNASNAAAAVGKVEQDTAVAAADVFLQAIEAIPFPANLAAAPAAAATVQAEMAPFAAQAGLGGGIGAAAEGFVSGAKQPILVHSGEVITDTPSLNLLASSAPKPADISGAAANAMKVTSDQIVMLQAGHVVVPRVQAAGLTNIFSQAGAKTTDAAGEPVPFGIKEIPQRLSTSTSTMISQIIERATNRTAEGGAKVSSARDGFSVSSREVVSSARDGFSISSKENVHSARDGFTTNSVASARDGFSVSSREAVSSARDGFTVSSVSSARDGFVISSRDNVSSARDGFTINSISSARDGFSVSSQDKVSSARDGFSVSSREAVSSAREGFSVSSQDKVSSARDGFSVPVLSAAQGAFLDKDTLVSAHKNETVLPPPLSVGLKNLIDVGGLSVPTALTSPSPSSTSNNSSTSTINNKTVHVRPNITVNQHGDAGGRMSHSEIANAVRVGVRKGLLNV